MPILELSAVCAAAVAASSYGIRKLVKYFDRMVPIADERALQVLGRLIDDAIDVDENIEAGVLEDVLHIHDAGEYAFGPLPEAGFADAWEQQNVRLAARNAAIAVEALRAVESRERVLLAATKTKRAASKISWVAKCAVQARVKFGTVKDTEANREMLSDFIRKHMVERGVRPSHIVQLYPLAVTLALVPTGHDIESARMLGSATRRDADEAYGARWHPNEFAAWIRDIKTTLSRPAA